MATKDVKVDAYIKKAEPFAQPILTHLRELVHKSCPEVEEVIKWSFPCFVYKKSILCSIASFKKHCAFGFWLQSKMEDPDGILVDRDKEVAMGSMGRITSVKELPSSKILSKYIKQAMNLIDAGVKITKTAAPKEKKELQVPVYKFLKTPLIRKYGEEFYATLCDAADEWKKEYGK